MITFDENRVSFFAFKKCKVSRDVVERKTLTAKGAGHNPAHRRLCKTVGGGSPHHRTSVRILFMDNGVSYASIKMGENATVRIGGKRFH